MANSFPKEVRIAFDEAVEGFEAALTLSTHVTLYKTNAQEMERSSDVKWIPQPYITQSFDGSDATANFGQQTQLVVPVSINKRKHVPMVFSDTELRDLQQTGLLKQAAQDRLAADIDVDVLAKASIYGSLVVKRTVTASGFDDVAQCDAIMNEQGIPARERHLALNSTDYNGMASNLQVASRSFVGGKSDDAYEKGYVGPVASFNTWKLDYPYRLPAAAGGGGITISTLDTTGQYYNPVALSVATTNEMSPVDNRYQTVTVSSTTSVVAGDRFTIAALNAVHHLTKTDTGRLKTFTVVAVPSSTTLTISPPIITNQLGTNDAAAMYQNCVINTKASNSAIVFLNTVTAPTNIFWQKNAIYLIPGTIVIPSGVGVDFMQATTKQGVQLTLQRQWDTNTSQMKWRIDTRWGTQVVNPEMAGIMEFSQS